MGRADPAFAAFCLAAIAADRKNHVRKLCPPGVCLSRSLAGRATDLRLSSQSLAADRALETVHTTVNGLHDTCRDLGRWGRDGQVLNHGVFGRKIETFTDRDYAAPARQQRHAASPSPRLTRRVASGPFVELPASPAGAEAASAGACRSDRERPHGSG